MVCPSWDLQLVLRALQYCPFEPLSSVELHLLMLKVFLLAAVALAHQLGELGSLSCLSPFLQMCDDRTVLRLGLGFVPKVKSMLYLQQNVILLVFFLDPQSPEEVALQSIDVRHSVLIYLDWVKEF
ncbi:hypothetical protein NDU88_002893 [Pleurodeles waltl]|uniref:Uncharacterized protein n=1 Tax=Pleurodeles waltl TaxID=8319 RepID=A0AAV7UAJ6_PLEWA|nr:hypothetical protein NDU88_002893 [Pleurodeles waltl]